MHQFMGTKNTRPINIVAKQPHNCKQSQRREIILPSDHQQYSKIVCDICGRWFSWGRDPQVTVEHEARKQVISQLLKIDFISSWQKEFLTSIRDRRVLVGKQSQTYEEIVRIYRRFLDPT